MNIKKPLAIKQPEVGRIILDLRLAFGLTKEQFAANLGFTHVAVLMLSTTYSQRIPRELFYNQPDFSNTL